MPFSGRGSVTLSVTTTSARVALPNRQVPDLSRPNEESIMLNSNIVRVMVDAGSLAASDEVYVVIGNASVVATAGTGVPLIPGIVETYALAPDDTHIAAIATANAAQLIATIGSEKK